MALDGTADSPPRAGLRGRLPELRLSDLFPDSFAVPPIATGSEAVAGAAATKAGAMIVDSPSTPLLEDESPDHDDPSSFSTDLEALRAAATGGPVDAEAWRRLVRWPRAAWSNALRQSMVKLQTETKADADFLLELVRRAGHPTPQALADAVILDALPTLVRSATGSNGAQVATGTVDAELPAPLCLVVEQCVPRSALASLSPRAFRRRMAAQNLSGLDGDSDGDGQGRGQMGALLEASIADAFYSVSGLR
jgi:hypothetical protein